MKKLLFISLMLIGMMTKAQDPPKLLKVNCKPAGEDTTFLKYEFEYNEIGLKAVTFTDSMTGEWCLYQYGQDTLRSMINEIGWIPLDHRVSENEIVRSNWYHNITYNVNSNYEITDYWTYWNVWYDYEYNWASDNLQNIYRNDTLMLFCSYSPGYRNPFYDMNKTFRVDPWGSYDFPVTIWDDINDTNLINIEFRGHIDGYPTEIDYYDKWDNLLYTEYFIYDVNVGVENELPLPPFTVLSISYYDLMGRETPKPKKGFYIERKITNKGIISTKHYIQ
jgi:hypothetical protein